MKSTLTVAVFMTGLLLALLFAPLERDGGEDLLLFFGRFHPLILHIPIGTLAALFLLEMFQWVLGFVSHLNYRTRFSGEWRFLTSFRPTFFASSSL